MAKQLNTRVIRLQIKTIDKISKIKGMLTYDQLIEVLLAAYDAINESEKFYRVNDKIFNDLLEARGEAIMQAIKAGEVPTMPTILVEIGQDTGE